MPIENLKTNYQSKPYLIGGDTLNRQNSAINALSKGHVSQPGASTLTAGGIHANLPPVPFLQGIAVISDASNACPVDPITGEFKAPCATVNKYLCRFRYYNTDSGTWEEIDEDLPLDAAGWYERFNTNAGPASSGPGYGAIPTYVVGDTINAYLDTQRNWLIPISMPPADQPTGEFYNNEQDEVEENPDVDEMVLEAYVEVRRPGVDGDWKPVIGVSFPLHSSGTTYYNSRSCFVNLACTDSTLVRVRTTRGPAQESDTKVYTYFSLIRFTGLGRRPSLAVSQPATFDAYSGGELINPWVGSASTIGRFKDSPTFTVVNDPNYNFSLSFLDPLDQWMISIELFLDIKVVGSDNSSSSTSPSISLPSASSSSSSSSTFSSSSSSSTTLSSLSSSSSQSLSTSSQSVSTSSTSSMSSSQSVSESSSSASDCVQFVECFEFDPVTCQMTVTYGEFCFPRGSGITVFHNIEPPC
jgi:hypothetical protein